MAQWQPIAYMPEVFTEEECDKIIAMRGVMTPGEVKEGNEEAKSHRNNDMCWLRSKQENNWMYKKSTDLVAQANGTYWEADVGYVEDMQLARYKKGDFYGWHLDIGPGETYERKLSFIVQLSNPKDYGGGAIEILFSGTPVKLPKDRGSVSIFPSFILHRVRKVTRGTRYSLVGWVRGEPYK